MRTRSMVYGALVWEIFYKVLLAEGIEALVLKRLLLWAKGSGK